MLSGEGEPGSKGSRAGGSQTEDMVSQKNRPIDTGPSSPSDDSANSPVGMTNEPARKSGSLQRKIIRASPFKKVGSFFAFIVSDQPLASTQTSKKSNQRLKSPSSNELGRLGPNVIVLLISKTST
ncbi:hypothetical protein T07_11539 [Trichinella nelsoni]|uniref:Uncharacterized protein n=1 Tax=Trichinella nelsoni TaxID=6336 RepID=A0A0V0RZV7_9BILA|nr:hypothetical protein T07_11539 [Trichinella nelsoni]